MNGYLFLYNIKISRYVTLLIILYYFVILYCSWTVLCLFKMVGMLFICYYDFHYMCVNSIYWIYAVIAFVYAIWDNFCLFGMNIFFHIFSLCYRLGMIIRVHKVINHAMTSPYLIFEGGIHFPSSASSSWRNLFSSIAHINLYIISCRRVNTNFNNHYINISIYHNSNNNMLDISIAHDSRIITYSK